MSLVSIDKIRKTFVKSDQEIVVLNELSLVLNIGQRVGILGASGAGKSTLLHSIAGLDQPTSGSVFWKGENLYLKNDDQRAKYRNQSVGFVFQFYHLLPELNALENVFLPCLIAGWPLKEAKKEARLWLERLGLAHRESHLPRELSGGEQQRVAIARAVILKPPLILADEPTGNLDAQSGQQVIKALLEVQKEKQSALVLVTHNPELAESMDQIYELKEGKLNHARPLRGVE